MKCIPRYLGMAFIVSGMYLPIAIAAENPTVDFCELIKNHANAGTLQGLILDKVTNVQIGQQRLDLKAGEGGTAHVPYIQTFDAVTHAPVDINLLHERDGGDYWGGDHLGFITQNNIVQILYYKDIHHPIYTIPVNGGTACNFKTAFKEITGTNAKEQELCNKLINGENLPSIPFNIKAPIQVDSKTYNWLASSNEAGNMNRIDFANNGDPRNVVEMSMSSSAGAGCSETFFDLLDDTGNQLASDNMRAQLLELENINLQDVFPIRANSTGYAACGNSPRFFSYQGKIYFEDKPKQWPPVDDGNTYHRVARIEKDNVIDVCNFSFKRTTEIPLLK